MKTKTLTLSEAMTVDLPEMDTEGVVVDRFTVDAWGAMVTNMESARYGRRGRVQPGEQYTRLVVDGVLWMSDTPTERYDHIDPWNVARSMGGRVLINGLGIGMVVGAMLALPNVEHVDVVEKDERIARLIGPHYASDRCTIHTADAYTIKWPVGTKWTVAWHDIWPEITADNLPGMHRLHRKYGRAVDWQGSWARYECEQQR